MNKQKKRPYDESKVLPKPTFVTSGVPKGFCERIPGVAMRCAYNFECWNCDYASRATVSFKNDPPPYPVIDEKSVFSDRTKFKYNYYDKVVALKPEALERLGYRPLLYFQFFKCKDGPGCLPNNDCLEIDGYLLAHPDVCLTLKRNDILGLPTLEACKRYDKYFFSDSVRQSGYLNRKGGDVYDCDKPYSEDLSTQQKIKF